MPSPSFQVPNGVVDGTNRLFTISSYLPKTTAVFLNGQLKRIDLDDGWVELSPVAGTIFMDIAPEMGDHVQVFYLSPSPFHEEEEVVRIRTVMNILPENAIQIVRGASKTIQLTIDRNQVDDDCNRGNRRRPVDLTGARVIFNVKRFYDEPEPLIRKISDDPTQILITNVTQGVVQIYLYPPDTQKLEPSNYLYDIWVVLASNKRYAVVPPTQFIIMPTVSWIP